jgi:hypothetical protein
VIVRKSLWAVGVALSVGAASVAIAACSSSDQPVAADASAPLPVSSCTTGGLSVAFSPMYSAFDGKHIFQVPAVVRGSNGNVVWSADSTMVQMETDKERPNEVLITMKRAGAVIINVQTVPDDSGSTEPAKCGSSLLTITAAQESDWEIGSARYNNGTSLHLAGSAMGNGGSPLETVGGPACNNCHGETATASVFTDVSHTPEQTGGFSDDDLLGIILHGQFPDGGFFDTSIVPYQAWMGFHRWADITPDQQRGIIVYLRSLTPAPQKGSANFGAFDTDSGAEDMDATTPPPDTGTTEPDTGIADAGPVDTGTPDTGVIDSGVADTGTIDTGIADAGTTDAALDASDSGSSN